MPNKLCADVAIPILSYGDEHCNLLLNNSAKHEITFTY